MNHSNARMKRENTTIETMLSMYCHGTHQQKSTFCRDCQELLEYSRDRLNKCPLQVDKPTCAKCPVHCYKPAMREKVRNAMRYAGPRMIYKHPVMALQHFVDGRKKVPVVTKSEEITT